MKDLSCATGLAMREPTNMAVASIANATYRTTARHESIQDVDVSEPKTFTPSELDRRLAAHLRRYLAEHRDVSTPYILARVLKVDTTVLYNLLNEKRGASIDLLYAMHKKLSLPADALLDDNPEQKYFQPGPNEGRRGRRPAREVEPGPPVSQRPAQGHGLHRKRGHG